MRLWLVFGSVAALGISVPAAVVVQDPMISLTSTVTLGGFGSVDNDAAATFNATAAEPGAGTAGGYLSSDPLFDMASFSPPLTAGLNPIDAIHFVTRDVAVPLSTVSNVIPAGSVLVSFDGDNRSIPNINPIPPTLSNIDDEDVVLFVPDTAGDHTSGNWYLFFDYDDAFTETANSNVDGACLVEQDVTVDGVLFEEGDLLISFKGPLAPTDINAAPEDIALFKPTAYGASTSGSFGNGGVPVFRGFFVGLGPGGSPNENVSGVHLVQQDTVIGDVTVNAGDFLLTIQTDSTSVGATGETISAGSEDIIRFATTSLGSVPVSDETDGTFTVLLNGDDADMGLSATSVNGLTLIPTGDVSTTTVVADDFDGPPLEFPDQISYTMEIINTSLRNASDITVTGTIPTETSNLFVLGTPAGSSGAGTTSTVLNVTGIDIAAQSSDFVTWLVDLDSGLPLTTPVQMSVTLSDSLEGGLGGNIDSNILETIPVELSVFRAD